MVEHLRIRMDPRSLHPELAHVLEGETVELGEDLATAHPFQR
jgi:hypothetical protein